jgi:hypothetical protein
MEDAVKLPFELLPNEQVVLITRRHWRFFVPRFVAYALVGLLPPIALLWALSASGHLKGLTLTVALVAGGAWLLLWIGRIGLLKYRYDNDIWAVTDQRVVDVDKPTPVRFHMSAAALVELEDITTSRNGILQTMLDYGNLECQTAGEREHFSFRGVPNPRAIAADVERESLAAKAARRPPVV